jgi:threonylcarbamoyladenosine tRNA methylthiotransferase MtaB
MIKKIAIQTFGCKLNFAESSHIMQEFAKEEYRIASQAEHADIFIIHSCAVTKNAEKKVRNTIRQCHRKNPNTKIIVIGCYAELSPKELSEIEGVSIIAGNNFKYNLQSLIETEEKQTLTGETKNNTFTPLASGNDRTRTFFKIQDGCDYFCSYCTIPLARFRSRSASIAATIEAFKKIETQKEIILTGVNIGDFGRKNNETFHDLLEEMSKSKQAKRIRLSSVEPDLMHDNIIQLIKDSNNLMPHFHLPLQAGTDEILKLMKRKYTTNFFRNLVNKIRSEIPNAYISCDILVGFPGETDELFKQTVNYIKELDINDLHVFSFSERPNTKAEQLQGKIIATEKNARSKIINAIAKEKMYNFAKQQANKKHRVLFEKQEINNYLYGFSKNYLRVKIKYNEKYINEIITVKTSPPDNDGILKTTEICTQD